MTPSTPIECPELGKAVNPARCCAARNLKRTQSMGRDRNPTFPVCAACPLGARAAQALLAQGWTPETRKPGLQAQWAARRRYFAEHLERAR